MTIRDTHTILKRIVNAFPEKKLNRATFLVYQEELADIPTSVLDKAVTQLIRTSTWFPRISEIRRTAEQIAGTNNFSTLLDPKVDTLTLESRKLENDYFKRGVFNLEAWNKLADQIERIGRHYQANELRHKARHIQASDQAHQRGEEYPSEKERQRYASYDNSTRASFTKPPEPTKPAKPAK